MHFGLSVSVLGVDPDVQWGFHNSSKIVSGRYDGWNNVTRENRRTLNT